VVPGAELGRNEAPWRTSTEGRGWKLRFGVVVDVAATIEASASPVAMRQRWWFAPLVVRCTSASQASHNRPMSHVTQLIDAAFLLHSSQRSSEEDASVLMASKKK
jgi:hypothetical protein